MDSSKRIKKHEPDVNPDPEPLSSDSSESSSSDSRESKKKRTKKKKRCQHQKDDSSNLPSSNDSDSSNDSHYRRKQRKDNKHRKNYPIRLCTTLTEKLLTTAYKLKIIRFTRPTHLRAMILIRLVTVIIDLNNAKKRNIRKRTR